MKKVFIILALTVATIGFSMNAFSAPEATLADEVQHTNVPFYDSETRIVYIPVLEMEGIPVFSRIELYYREDGVFEIDTISEYDEATDHVDPEVVYVEKIVYQERIVEKIIYEDKIVLCGDVPEAAPIFVDVHISPYDVTYEAGEIKSFKVIAYSVFEGQVYKLPTGELLEVTSKRGILQNTYGRAWHFVKDGDRYYTEGTAGSQNSAYAEFIVLN